MTSHDLNPQQEYALVWGCQHLPQFDASLDIFKSSVLDLKWFSWWLKEDAVKEKIYLFRKVVENNDQNLVPPLPDWKMVPIFKGFLQNFRNVTC